MTPQPLLRLVDPQTGEVTEHVCPECQAKDDRIAGLERDINGWRVRYYELKRDKEAEAKAHELWPQALWLFGFYCRLTGKPGKPRKLNWGHDRFELVRPFLAEHGLELCARAIAGRVFDHFQPKRANGTTVHFWEWERIFGSLGRGQTASANFEESANRAPADWRERYEFDAGEVAKAKVAAA